MFPSPDTYGTLTIDGNCCIRPDGWLAVGRYQGHHGGNAVRSLDRHRHGRPRLRAQSGATDPRLRSGPWKHIRCADRGNSYRIIHYHRRHRSSRRQILGVTYSPTTAQIGVIGNPVIPKLQVSDILVNEPLTGTITGTFTVSLDKRQICRLVSRTPPSMARPSRRAIISRSTACSPSRRARPAKPSASPSMRMRDGKCRELHAEPQRPHECDDP